VEQIDGTDLRATPRPEPAVRPKRARRPRGAHPPAVVLGDNDLIRALGLAGIPSAVVTRPQQPKAHSRFVSDRIEWADNWGDPGRLLDNVMSFAATCPDKPPLLFQHDGDLAFVARNSDALRWGLRFTVGDAELVEQLLDKTLFAELAGRIGLPVPRSFVLRPAPGDDTPDLPLGYPVILKPLTRRDLIWKPLAGDSKALRVESRRALGELWPVLAEAGFGMVAQELIPGGEHRIESYHAYVDERGEPAGEFTGRKVRTLPREFGQTTALEITDEGDVREAGRECMRRLGLQGVAKLDFKRAPDGKLLLLEVNARFNLWHLPGAVAGVNLPALVYADLMGLPRPVMRSRPRAGVRWTVPWHDALAAREQRVGLARWAAWQLGCETRHVLSVDDPMPFLRGLLWPRVARRVGLRR
jgi:predicted ATP-grasp superfamily ATP-dependent carboligase